MSERATPDPPRFTERLTVPWWWWPLGIGVAVLIAAEFHLGYPGVRAWLPYLITVPISIAVLIWFGRVRVALRDDELWVGPAHLPLRYIGRVDVIAAQHKRRALGPDLDPAAYVVHRAWIGPALRVEVTDPADPTPYWVFSSRHAERLAGLLRVPAG